MRLHSRMSLVFTVSLLSAPAALASPTVTVLDSFNPAVGQLPESITTDDAGNLYFSMSLALNELTVDKQLVTVAPIPAPAGASALGVKVGPDGFVYVVTAAFGGTTPSAFVWRVSPAKQVSLFATLPAESIPNDLVFDDDRNLYVTDSALGQIWKIDPQGNPTVWFADPLLLGNSTNSVVPGRPLGANGIAFGLFERALYVSNTDYGRIVRIRVHHGRPQGIEVVATSDQLIGADGIAFDIFGTLYVAVNAGDRIGTVSPFGTVSTFVEGSPLDAPSSVAFGTRRSDRFTLYMTNFAILRASGLKPGTPEPSLASVPVPFPGLPLER